MESSPPKQSWFPATHWSIILKAGGETSTEASEALERLCQSYWYPVYAFVRRKGYGVPEAQDLTQSFFARILAGDFLQRADPAKGRFRTFLLVALQHFLAGEWNHAQRLKRGGGRTIVPLDESAEVCYQRELSHDLTPEKLYERRWAMTLMQHALDRLRVECEAEGKCDLFRTAESVLSGDKPDFTYAAVAAGFGMTEGALRTAVYRLRKRYGLILRNEIAQTVTHPEEVEAEIQHLFGAL